MERAAEVLEHQRYLDIEATVPAQTAIGRQRSGPSKLLSEQTRSLMVMLTGLAEVRQVPVNEATLLMYARELREYELQDVSTAVRQIGREPRAEFSTSFPALGDLIARVEQVRMERTRPAKWVPCGKCNDAGLIYVDAAGNPCDPSTTPNRRMRDCACKVEWRRLKAERSAREGKS